MKNWPFFIFVNLTLAVGIFLCAIIGRSMGIQGPALAISVVWPATGLSLAALLLFGYGATIGIIIGIFAYNLLFLTGYPPTLKFIHLDIAIFFLSLGSVVQALLSAYIIRNYSTPFMFRTVQDIFIFLVPASLLSCLIGSTVGVTTLAITGGVEKNLILPVWLTFWLGDSAGVYVITPLLVIWTIQPKEIKFSDHIPSILCMTLLFIAFSFVSYFFGHPLPHLFVPISIWAAYLFRMHGASLAIFLMTAAAIAFATSQGYEGTSLISLITFIGVSIAASLIIAAVVNEREEAWALLDSRNIYLEKEVDVKGEILEQVRSDVSHKKNLASLSPALKLIFMQVFKLSNDIEHESKKSLKIVEDIQELLTSNEKEHISEKLHLIAKGLFEILNSEKLIRETIEISNN